MIHVFTVEKTIKRKDEIFHNLIFFFDYLNFLINLITNVKIPIAKINPIAKVIQKLRSDVLSVLLTTLLFL